MIKKTLTILTAAIFLAVSMAAMAADTGKCKVKLVDRNGVTINGTVFATKSGVTKKCATSAGTCTLTGLAGGTWVITAKTAGGAKGGPVNKTVKVNDTVSVTVQVQVGMVRPRR